MLNKKGFTIAEVLVSFCLITVVLASIITTTVFYRDKLKQEEVISQLVDFKNTVTKVVYDDILSKGVSRVESCVNVHNCVNIYDGNGNFTTLKIEEVTTVPGRGIYINYAGTKYMLPDSDLGVGEDRICDFIGGFDIRTYNNELYSVKAIIKHKDLNLQYEILFVMSANNV